MLSSCMTGTVSKEKWTKVAATGPKPSMMKIGYEPGARVKLTPGLSG